MVSDEFLQLSADRLGILVWHKTKTDFGCGPTWDDRLTPLALVTAHQTMDLKRWASPTPFQSGIPLLTAESIDSKLFSEGIVREMHVRPHLAFARFECDNALVEVRQLNSAVRRFYLGEDSG